MQGLGFRVQGLGVQGSGVWGFRVYSLGVWLYRWFLGFETVV